MISKPIKELNDEEILNFLMTNEFEGDYSPDELKYLLHKWKYFYRIIHGKNELLKTNVEGETRKNTELQDTFTQERNDLLTKIADKDNLLQELKNRELTWKERFKGKIILTEDEISRI